MRPSVVYTVKARQDVQQEWQFLKAESGPHLADRFLAALNQTSKTLALTPGIGRLCEFELKSVAAARQMPLERPFSNWLLFYLPRQSGILVFRVAHGARDLPALFQ